RRPLVRLGALAGGVDRVVLEQDDGVAPLASDDLAVQSSLQLPRLPVVGLVRAEVEVQEFQRHVRHSRPASARPNLGSFAPCSTCRRPSPLSPEVRYGDGQTKRMCAITWAWSSPVPIALTSSGVGSMCPDCSRRVLRSILGPWLDGIRLV